MKPKRRIRRHKENTRERSPFFKADGKVNTSGKEFFSVSHAQAKLKIGQVNDPYEQQADGTAHAIVNNSDHSQSIAHSKGIQKKEETLQLLKIRKQEEEEAAQTKLQKQEEEEAVQTKLQKQEEEEAMQMKLQRQEAEEEEALQTKLQMQEEEEVQTKLQRQAEAEEEEVQAKLQKQEEEEVQTKSEVFRKEDTAVSTQSTESRISQAKGAGQPLPDDILVEMEAQLGSSFKKVRIHDDSEAHALCEDLNALAFASGNDIFFKKGSYQPYSREGKFLLVHELTHVLQQRNKTF